MRWVVPSIHGRPALVPWLPDVGAVVFCAIVVVFVLVLKSTMANARVKVALKTLLIVLDVFVYAVGCNKRLRGSELPADMSYPHRCRPALCSRRPSG